MGLFSKKYNPEIEWLKQKLNTLEGQVEIMNTSLKNLRAIMNKKLGGDHKDEDLNNSVILPTDGNFKFNR